MKLCARGGQAARIHNQADSTHILGKLLDQVRQYQELTEQIKTQLPPGLAPGLYAAQLQNDRLVLQAPSSAWATRLRFAATGLRKHFPQVKTIRVMVLPYAQVVEPAPPIVHPKRILSPENAERLRILAANVEDPLLAEALLRLASHVKL